MTLKELQIGKSAVVDTVGGTGALRQHFLDMGLVPGAQVTLIKLAPMGDPMELRIHGYELTLRLDDAAQIGIIPTEKVPAAPALVDDKMVDHPGLGEGGKYHIKKGEHPLPDGTTLTFALAGNQNCGKTTLFNQLTGSNQHVGNFPGVTVDRKSGAIKGHPETEVTDLPGIYSLRPYTAEEIVTHCLPLLGKKQYAAIARQLRLPESEVRRACQIIQQLEPYPARREEPDETPVYVIPDVIIEEADGQWQAALNERYLPRFSVSRQYLELLESSGDTEVRQYLKEKLRQAQWMLACLEKRQSTLQRCADLILQTQSDFFQGTTTHLSPMTMRAAAEQMQVHESTVGRCVKDKYLQCRQGTFPLRYFFSGEVNGFSGQAVRMEIRALVRAEDGHRPLSDSRIADMLDAKGISVARRTVAKYRQEMGIPPACQRKQA